MIRRPRSLRRRVLLAFTLVTLVPMLTLSVFSAALFNIGVQAWFNERVSTAVDESLAVAQAYLDEHRDNIRTDALAMAADLDRYIAGSLSGGVEFNRYVSAQAANRLLTEVVVFQRNRIIAQGRLSFSLTFESLPISALERARAGEVVVLTADGESSDKVRALVKLNALDDAYLLVGRLVDEKVITHMQNTQGAVSAYQELKNQLVLMQWGFSAAFLLLAFLLLATALWYGRRFTRRLTQPLASLSAAADRVRAGDYSKAVPVKDQQQDEIFALARAFNRMMEQLTSQRHDLIEANRLLDDRRRFTEEVLSGVSAGVLALDAEKRVRLLNRSAQFILSDARQNQSANEVLPGLNELLTQAETGGVAMAQGSMTLGNGEQAVTLHVRAALERNENDVIIGYIVTFDDITRLVAAQRTAAWSDVARRVAHEIKNPLTPIALSAERLKRKYQKMLEGEERDTFNKYVDTITRHVADIGRMVEEFVAFARMPGAVMKPTDMVPIVKKVLFSEQIAHPGIRYVLERPPASLPMQGDERQLSQVLTNVLKNAAEAIEGAQVTDLQKQGVISLSFTTTPQGFSLEIHDNGPGFPPESMQKMLEPYVTTRAKGTGLGLAIVKKIVEEHKGNMILSNHPEGGAKVVLSFEVEYGGGVDSG